MTTFAGYIIAYVIRRNKKFPLYRLAPIEPAGTQRYVDRNEAKSDWKRRPKMTRF